MDFSAASEKDCIEFAERIKSGEIEIYTIEDTLNYIKNKKNYTEEQAIFTIKNLVLTLCYTPFERTDYLALCGETLIYLTNFIKKEGSTNFKIYYAIYKSQIEEDEKSIKYEARVQLICDLDYRFKSFTDQEKELYKAYYKTFINLISLDYWFLRFKNIF